jgi:hypothetical protein
LDKEVNFEEWDCIDIGHGPADRPGGALGGGAVLDDDPTSCDDAAGFSSLYLTSNQVNGC